MPSESASPSHTNRLARATSPYLLQHAHNPVDWYPWGEEALGRARVEDKPILLSIGYSACHWCHVMERESFENEATAALMNESFVCIKVDREERPDLDDVYMAATLAMNQGQGGWPMTVFLTPEQEPFFAGTYFPPEDRWGRPGFPTLLTRLRELWQNDREGVREQAAELAGHLRQNASTAPGTALGEDELRSALAAFARDFDERYGGFGGAPKFPPATALRLLLRLHRRFGDAQALEMVGKTLEEMARGGMYDQVGGGFHRYSVDERWLVPHFEKMLYDNAMLARAYLEGSQATGDAFFARIAREVLDYVLREMTDPAGGFYSATDADSEGEEGKFFVWTPSEVEEVLGAADAKVFCAYYDIEERGNWEGKAIPNTSRTGTKAARALGLTPEALEATIAALRPRLYQARQKRVPPGLDDKVLTAWNGLMISALAEGHRVLGDPRYLEAAEKAARFVLSALRAPDGGLQRTWRAGRAHITAFLEDYAYLAEGLLDLYEAGGSAVYLREAETLLAILRRDFADEAGGFFSTPRDHEALIVRPREGHDGALPNPNAVAAYALARLSYHLDREELREQAAAALRAWGRAIARQPRGFAQSLLAVDLLLDGPTELAFVGAPGDPGLAALHREVARHFVPHRLVAQHDPARGEADLPLLRGKGLANGRSALYVCRNFACASPVTDPAQVAAALAGPVPSPATRSPLARVALPGHATPEGTAAFARRHGGHGYQAFGDTGLHASLLGFGGYRVDDQTPEHRAALRQALSEGVNVIDTSSNYTDGGSERLVGEVLAERVEAGGLDRAEVIVVTKVGYVQGRNLEVAEEREAQGQPFPDMVKYGPGIWHCLHPEFLEDQLARALARLGLATLDVLLLHNPEYFLKDAHERSHGSLEKRRAEFASRLGQAFAWLETQVAAGRIRFYGVSSNTCTSPADDPEATSLTEMLELARAAGGAGHRFRVLQLPLNLFESGAGRERNNGPGLAQTVLERAAAEALAVLINRPLNAFVNDNLIRLAEVSLPGEGPGFEAQARALGALEEEFRTEMAPHLQTPEGSLPPAQFFRWSSELSGTLPHVRGIEHWDALEAQRIVPRLVEVLQALDGGLQGAMAERWRAWRARYVPELQRLLAAGRREAAARTQALAERITGVLDPLLPAPRRSETLSRKALWVLASTPGVTTVLVGMRTPGYVADSLAVLAWPALANAMDVYARTAEMAP